MNHIIPDSFEDYLTRLDMLRSDEEATNLFFVADRHKIQNPHIQIVLEQAERYGVNAVFVRTFRDTTNRSPLPQVYIYRETDLSFDENRYAEIHRRLWNAGVVPLVFIFTAGYIKVLNCRQEPKVERNTKKPLYTPFRKLEKLIAVERAAVTRDILAGTLWDNPAFKKDFALEKTAYYKLLHHLKAFRAQLVKDQVLSTPLVDRLLVMAMLVKYLSERQDSDGNRVFSPGFFSQFSRASSDDFDLIFSEQGGCVKLFDYLSSHFNGDIFKLTEEEKAELESANLSPVGVFLKGDQDPDTRQGFFWPLYSFEDLPVELISNIYEEFLAKKDGDSKGIVYTPLMLVDFLLDQCLPLDPASLSLRILDPACGSGVFLVGAFERLVHCWRIANHWKQPTHLDLKGILKNNIFGFDKEQEAVMITAFSLCVALCQKIDPLVIWNDLQFDDLRARNLREKDFFESVESGEITGSFDLVIGNPPFDSELESEAARRIEDKLAKERPKLPDTQIALLFLEQSFKVTKEYSKVCLIQPAGPLLYNANSLRFRGYLFEKFNISTVFDFTALEGVLFSKAKVAAAAVIASNSPDRADRVLHLTFRRTRPTKERLLFELDPYDFHWVPQKSIARNRFIWKANLFGGGRLHRLVEKYATGYPTLRGYLAEKKKNEGWCFAEGYSVGSGGRLNKQPDRKELTRLSSEELKQRFKLKKVPKPASWITGEPNVPPKALTRDGINWDAVKPCEDLFFERARGGNRKIFIGPHVLIREVVEDTGIPATFSNKDLVFSKQVIGIHAPEGNEDKLLRLATRLNDSGVYGAWAALMSSRMLVSRDTSLLASDIFALPYSEDGDGMEFNDWEKAIMEDIGAHLSDFRRAGEDSIVLRGAQPSDLKAFGDMYCDVLNPLYGQFRQLSPIHFGSFICFPFCYGKVPLFELPQADKVSAYLEELLYRKLGSRLFVNRVLRLYEQNIIIMIKPNQIRYWLRSVALRDADETLIDLLEQGY